MSERNTSVQGVKGTGIAHSYHPLYRTWEGMKMRCFKNSHKGYRHYGGRGITVCERWFDFTNFLSDMGDARNVYMPPTLRACELEYFHLKPKSELT